MSPQELERRLAKEAAYVVSGAQSLIISRAFNDEPRTPEEEQHAKDYVDHLVLFLEDCDG